MRANKHCGSLDQGQVAGVAMLSAKGRVTIPKAVLDKHGWSAGTKLKLSEENGIVLLVEAGKKDD